MNSKPKITINFYRSNFTFFRWFLVGLTTFTIDYVLFLICFGPIKSVLLANFISGLSSTSFNYFAHHSWTFKTDLARRSTSIRYIVNLAYFWMISTLILKGLISLDLSPRLAKLIPVLIITPFSYFVLKNLVFKKDYKES